MSAENVLSVDVRRDFVLVDALREAHKKKFDPRKYMKVQYVVCSSILDCRLIPCR